MPDQKPAYLSEAAKPNIVISVGPQHSNLRKLGKIETPRTTKCLECATVVAPRAVNWVEMSWGKLLIESFSKRVEHE